MTPKPGGYELNKDTFWMYMAILFAIYGVFLVPGCYLQPREGMYCPPSYKPPHNNRNTTTTTCGRPDIFAFEMVMIFGFIYLAYLSLPQWLGSGSSSNSKTATKSSTSTITTTTTPEEERVLGYQESSIRLANFFTAFQLWTFIVCPFIPEMSSVVMMVHHSLSITVGWFCLEYQYFHDYAPFFLGISELSSIPLIFNTLGGYFPPTLSSDITILQKTFNSDIFAPIFALLFGYYRVYHWIFVSYRFWGDCLFVMKQQPTEERKNTRLVLTVTLVINFLLTALQLYWFRIILGKVWEVVGWWW